MRTPENGRPWIYDFEICGELKDLRQTLAAINNNGYELVCVTPFTTATFVVFFRRPLR